METDPITTQVTLSAIIVWLLQYLKGASWFPIKAEATTAVLRTLGAVAAMLAAVGITVAFDKEAGVLTIAGLTQANLIAVGIASVKGLIYQELIYKGVVKPTAK